MRLFSVWVVLISVFLASCSSKDELVADFNLLLKERVTDNIQLDAKNAQELDKKKRNIVVEKGLTYRVENNELVLDLVQSGASLKISTTAVGLPDSWKRFHEIQLVFENKSIEDINATIVLWAPRGRLPDTVKIEGNKIVTKSVNLHDLPLIGSPTEKYRVNELELQFTPAITRKIYLKSITLNQKRAPKDFVVTDKFGQRKSKVWSGKVKDESGFRAHRAKENGVLQNQFDPELYDRYHGLQTRKKYLNTGYFSLAVEIINGDKQWFFVTPEGNPFWSFGVTGIRPKKALHAVTLVNGNEQLFEELPSKIGAYARAYIDSTFSFYYANILQKYGNVQGWREMTFNRLNSWGLNTIGNWAEDTLLFQSKTPFTYALDTDVKKWNKDVYDPGWIKYVDSVFAKAQKWKENQYLLGYFVDNEGGWGNLKLLENLPEDAYLRQVLKEYLVKEYNSIEAYNYRYESNYNSWDELVKVKESNLVADEVVILLESIYTEKYFKTVSETLKKYDPNHLYMGCRFTRKLKPEHVLKIAGKYCDVITVNVYSYEPIKKDMEAWHQLTGRPILIGEHQAALNSPRQLPLRWQTFDEEERYDYFINYVSKWAKMPFSLGSHWYQYSDQHITGRASNGENQIIGFVDITDQPYQKMIEAARYNSAQIYQWHGLESTQTTSKLP